MRKLAKPAHYALFGLGFGGGLATLGVAFGSLFAHGGSGRIFEFTQASTVSGAVALTPLTLGVVFHIIGKRQAGLEAQRDAAARAERELRQRVEADGVTGLKTRAALVARLQELAASGLVQSGAQITAIQIETGGVRFVNDTMGLAAGDELLVQISRRLGEIAGENRECYRLGGDDFVVVAIDDASDLARFARNLVARLEEPYEVEGFRIPLRAVAGAAVMGAADRSGTEVLAHCDLAIEQARKGRGGGAVVFSDELADDACQRMIVEQELQQAIERKEFFLVFQPIVDATTGATRACEALLRWQHPRRGVVAPAEFIPLAEKSGLISRMGEFVLRQACMEATKWPAHVKVSVNVSPAQFRNRRFHIQVVDALRRSRLPGDRLILEITESLLIENMDLVKHTFDLLRERGVRFALDDFGTGFSSINHLRSLKLDTLKLDKSFADRIVGDERELDVVRSIVDLSKAFDLNTTIEGVESGQQLEILRKQGIQHAQGFYFARPMPAEDLAEMLQSETAAKTLRAVS